MVSLFRIGAEYAGGYDPRDSGFVVEARHKMRRLRRGLLTACLILTSVPATPWVSAGSTVAVRRGRSYGSRIFPDNVFTVADASQLTGRRINFRQGIDYPSIGGVVQPSCTNADYSICDGFAQLNKLDGFDLQPRVVVPFTGAIDLGSVNASNFFIGTSTRTFVSGFRQLTFDPATNTLSGI